MIRLATTPIHKVEIPEGRTPVIFSRSEQIHLDLFLPELESISRQLWTYLGYSGQGVLWADNHKSAIAVYQNTDKIKKFFWLMEKWDIDWRSYCYLVLPLCHYSKWERLLLLVNSRQHWHWIEKLRKHVDSSEDLDDLADFVFTFMEKQIETYGYARIKTSSSIQKTQGSKHNTYRGKYYAVYTELANRIKQLKKEGVDPKIWLDVKFDKAKHLDYVYLSTLVNYNGFDPDINELRSVVNDEWSAIRKFLGLTRDCKFPDDCIPAGWQPAAEDYRNLCEIARVTKDGFYYYTDGEQRRGKFHYMKNRYHAIKCTPNNFEKFLPNWKDARLLTSRPTWTEYSQYAVYPGLWDSKGQSTNGRMPSVRWRKS